MKHTGAAILGAIFGLLAGVGLYLYLIEAGSFDAASKAGLVFPAGGIVAGILVGALGGRKPIRKS